MKKISELTEEEGKEILNYVFPDEDYIYKGLSFEPVKSERGGEYVTMDGSSIIGIRFIGGMNNDGMVLHFNHTKVVLWLYQHGYDIGELLEENAYMSEMESDFESFAFEVEWMSKGEGGFKDRVKHNWNLDYVKNKCKELVEKYYYKDYKC